MKAKIYSKEHATSQSFQAMVEEKLSKLDKYFHKETEAKVTLSNVKGNKKLEVTIPHQGIAVRAESTSDDYYKSLDEVMEKLYSQLRKYKTRMEKRSKGESIKYINNEVEKEEGFDEFEDDNLGKITKFKKFPLKPMDEEEAVLQMEMLGHNFFVFKFQDGKTGVVYKRKDGHYGLIEEE